MNRRKAIGKPINLYLTLTKSLKLIYLCISTITKIEYMKNQTFIVITTVETKLGNHTFKVGDPVEVVSFNENSTATIKLPFSQGEVQLPPSYLQDWTTYESKKATVTARTTIGNHIFEVGDTVEILFFNKDSTATIKLPFDQGEVQLPPSTLTSWTNYRPK